MVITTKFGNIEDSMAKYVRATKLCDFDVAEVKKLANELQKSAKTPLQAIREVHDYVATFPIGFDPEDWPASKLLKQERGQCNTKTTMAITLLRAMGIPARVHAWKIDKVVHRRYMPWILYAFTPKHTLFTYPEIYYKGEWQLMSEILTKKSKPDWNVCPFDDGDNRKHPLKKEWIHEDLGYFWHPDSVYKKFGTNSSGWRRPFFPIAQLLLNKQKIH